MRLGAQIEYTRAVTASVETVAAHYDVFPYPTVTTLSLARPAGFKRGALDMLLRRRAGDRLPARAKVWVAGCGQQQGAHWAMCFPEGEVVASDISATTLANARSLADQLGLRNVRFERIDLMNTHFEAEFDLVVSTGVVHHLPDPAVGLANIRRALKPSGALYFMVYSRVHREPLAMFRQLLQTLAPDEDHDARYELACELIDRLLASPRCSVPARSAFEILQKSKGDRSFVADCLLHPLEHSYDVDGLMELLAGAGLRFTSWTRPSRWRLEEYLDVPALVARLAGRDPIAEYKAVYHAAGYAGPLLELLAEPADAPLRAPYSVAELAKLPLVCRREHDVVLVEGGRVTRRGVAPAFVVEGEVIRNAATGPFGDTGPWQLPAYTEPLLAAFDGRRPAGEVIAAFADEFGEESILSVLDTLSPRDLSMLAPLW